MTKHKSKPAKASDYLHRLRDYRREHPDMIAIRYNRESSRPQDHEVKTKVLRRVCKKRNIPTVRFYCETKSGKILDNGRQKLLRAVRKARAKIKQGKHAVILATSTDRFLRNADHDTKYNRYVLPTEAEFEQLRKLTRNVPLVTYLHPDMPPDDVRRRESEWGQWARGNKGGRPAKKRKGWTIKRREKKLPRVRRLLNRGKNVTEIARKLRVARSTVDDWVEKYI